nr:MAG TPA: hypothetical protein [Caudoviricetes sp.]
MKVLSYQDFAALLYCLSTVFITVPILIKY